MIYSFGAPTPSHIEYELKGGTLIVFYSSGPCSKMRDYGYDVAANMAMQSRFAKWMYDRFRNSANEFSDKGFKEEFRDGSNQARHYAGGFFVGFTLGAKHGLALLNGRELVGDLSNSVFGTIPGGIPYPMYTPNSVKDKALNEVAVKHGDDLNDRDIKVSDVPGLIRKEICE